MLHHRVRMPARPAYLGSPVATAVSPPPTWATGCMGRHGAEGRGGRFLEHDALDSQLAVPSRVAECLSGVRLLALPAAGTRTKGEGATTPRVPSAWAHQASHGPASFRQQKRSSQPWR